MTASCEMAIAEVEGSAASKNKPVKARTDETSMLVLVVLPLLDADIVIVFLLTTDTQ